MRTVAEAVEPGVGMTLRDAGEFVAVGSDGRRCVIRAWADDDGNFTLETADGQLVSRLRKGRYQLVRPAVELTSDDPNAP